MNGPTIPPTDPRGNPRRTVSLPAGYWPHAKHLGIGKEAGGSMWFTTEEARSVVRAVRRGADGMRFLAAADVVSPTRRLVMPFTDLSDRAHRTPDGRWRIQRDRVDPAEFCAGLVDASKLSGWSAGALRRLCWYGLLPAIRDDSGRILLRPDDVVAARESGALLVLPTTSDRRGRPIRLDLRDGRTVLVRVTGLERVL